MLLQLAPVAIHWYGLLILQVLGACIAYGRRVREARALASRGWGLSSGIEFVILVADIRVEACTYDQH